MAEIIGVFCSEVMVAALIPALLFFASNFFMVHLQGQRNNIAPAPVPG